VTTGGEVPQAQRGDEPVERGWDEFAPLYDEHHERLYRVALLLCHGSEALAQDAVAETFVRIFPDWAEDRVDDVFSHARRTLVTHVMGRHRGDEVGARPRRSQRRRGRAERSLAGPLADATTTFRLLEQLPATQRTAVVLRYFEDLSHDQIASIMGSTPAAARDEVGVGLQQLRTLMGERGPTR